MQSLPNFDQRRFCAAGVFAASPLGGQACEGLSRRQTAARLPYLPSVVCLAAATAGFLVWNYPRGLIFTGEGGAYLWGVFHDEASRRMLMRNNRTSPWLWLWSFTLLTVAPAILFWDNTVILMVFCAVFVITYVVAYMMLVRFKVPKWLRGNNCK